MGRRERREKEEERDAKADMQQKTPFLSIDPEAKNIGTSLDLTQEEQSDIGSILADEWDKTVRVSQQDGKVSINVAGILQRVYLRLYRKNMEVNAVVFAFFMLGRTQGRQEMKTQMIANLQQGSLEGQVQPRRVASKTN